MTALQHVIEAARRAVLTRADSAPHLDRVGGVVQHLDPIYKNRSSKFLTRPPFLALGGRPAPADRPAAPSLNSKISESSLPVPTVTRPIEPPAPTVRAPAPPPAPPGLPWASCGPDELVEGLELGRGPRALHELLHRLAADVAQVRGYAVAPSQVTIHQAQELLAAALGCHRVTVWRWTRHLKALGLVDAREHYTGTVDGTRKDGTLYAVSLRPGHRAHLTHDDLSHPWRNLDADRKAGHTAWNALQRSSTHEGVNWYSTLKVWAVTPGQTDPPLEVDRCSGLDGGPQSLQDVVYTLPLLAEAHPSKRAALVGILGAALARSLGDPHSRRYWCKVVWSAWAAEVEGRGGLQVLAAQVARVEADQAEWIGLKNPAALLASRLRAA